MTAAGFVTACVTPDPAGRVSRAAMYAAYCAWMRQREPGTLAQGRRLLWAALEAAGMPAGKITGHWRFRATIQQGES